MGLISQQAGRSRIMVRSCLGRADAQREMHQVNPALPSRPLVPEEGPGARGLAIRSWEDTLFFSSTAASPFLVACSVCLWNRIRGLFHPLRDGVGCGPPCPLARAHSPPDHAHRNPELGLRRIQPQRLAQNQPLAVQTFQKVIHSTL